MKWSPRRYDELCRQYEDHWSAIDEALYRLCRQHADHRSPNSVNAKLWIIGRTYATGIERKIPTRGTQGSSLSQLAEHMLSQSSELDAMFARLAKIAEPLTPDKLTVIVAEHGGFVDLLKSVLRKKQSPRSFASKYMHFHCPAVPILDSVASAAIQGVVSWNRSLAVFDPPPKADREYFRFVVRFWHLYEQARRDRPSVRVKLLDYYLLGAEDGS